MAIGNPAVYADFSGGNNKEAGPYLLSENQCQDSRNVYANALGALVKRRGFSEHSTIETSAPANALDGPAHSLAAANLTPNRYLLAVGKTPSAATDSIVGIDESGEARVLKTGLTQGRRWEFVQGPVSSSQGPIYGVNGVDTPQYWSGATASTATAEWTAVNDTGGSLSPHPAKECQYLVYHLDKFWASGDLSKPGRIYSTGVDGNGLPDPRNWDSDYTDDVDPADGEQITGLGKVGPYLVVFKGRKTYVLTDPVSRAYRTISSNIGCISHRSIVETARGTMFLSEDLGVCVTDGSSVNRVSDAIQPFLKDILDSQIVNVKNAAACYFDDSYWLSLPYQSSSNSITLQYNLETNSWWIHTCVSNQFALLDPVGSPRLYSAHPTAQRIERAFAPNVYADAGQTYESYWEGPFWAWGAPHMNKRLHQLRVDGRGFWQLSIKESFNRPYSLPLDDLIWEEPTGGTELFGEGPELFGDLDPTIVFGSQQGLIQKRYATPSRGWGRAWSLRITDGAGGSNDLMELYAVTAFIRTRTD
jgi:hypothetical protein